MASYLQRKYTDLIFRSSSEWVNWDPSIKIQVGAYGFIDKETGDLRVEGNIYDPEFQAELDTHGITMNMADYLPQEGPVEKNLIITSQGAKRIDSSMNKKRDVKAIATTPVKGQWLFKRGKRDALLVLHNPLQSFLPPNVVLETLYKVEKLIGKWLVTSIRMCPAYFMHLSDKSDDKVSLALVAQAPSDGIAEVTSGSNGGFAWQVDAHSGHLRKACDISGDYTYTPLFALKRPIGRTRRCHSDQIEPESGDDLWCTPFPPWDPLDEDGEEDLIDMSDIEPVDSFPGLAAGK